MFEVNLSCIVKSSLNKEKKKLGRYGYVPEMQNATRCPAGHEGMLLVNFTLPVSCRVTVAPKDVGIACLDPEAAHSAQWRGNSQL